MSKGKPKPKPKNNDTGNWKKAFTWFCEIIAKLVDRFGWPGAFLVLAYFFIERHASPDQKRAMIDKFVLGIGIENYYQLLIAIGVFLVLFVAQNVYWRRKVNNLEEEVQRLGAWKSEHQEKLIGNLHSTGGSK